MNIDAWSHTPCCCTFLVLGGCVSNAVRIREFFQKVKAASIKHQNPDSSTMLPLMRMRLRTTGVCCETAVEAVQGTLAIGLSCFERIREGRPYLTIETHVICENLAQGLRTTETEFSAGEWSVNVAIDGT